MSQADVIAAVRAFLQADPGVAAAVGTQAGYGVRAFGGEFPRQLASTMPGAAVVVKAAGGGLLGAAQQRYGDTRVDVDCYGRTPHEAWDVYLDVAAAFDALDADEYAGGLLKGANVSSRGIQARDPDTDWPVVVATWQVVAGKDAA